MGKIAIEPNLTPIENYLAQKGYQVECINPGAKPGENLGGYDAFIVTGQSSNFLGIEDTQARVAVIDASGMTPEDVFKALQKQEKHPVNKFIL